MLSILFFFLLQVIRAADWFPGPGFDQYGIQERKAMVQLKKSGIYDSTPFELFPGFTAAQIDELAKDAPDMNIIKGTPLQISGWGVNPNSYFSINRAVPMEPSLQKALANFDQAHLLTAKGAENTQYMSFLRLQSEAIAHYEPIKIGPLAPGNPAKVAFQQFQAHENALFAGREAAYNKLNFKGIDSVLASRVTSVDDILKSDGQLAATEIINPKTGKLRDQVKGTIAEGFDSFLAKSDDQVKALGLGENSERSWAQFTKTFKSKQFTADSVNSFIAKNGKKNKEDSEKLVLALWEEIKSKMGAKAASTPSFNTLVDSVSRDANLGLGASEKSGLLSTFAARGSTLSAEEISHVEVAALQKNLANGAVCTPLIRRHFAKRSNAGVFCRLPGAKITNAAQIGSDLATAGKGLDTALLTSADTVAAESHPIASLVQNPASSELTSNAKTGATSAESSLLRASLPSAATGLELGNEGRVAATLASEEAAKLAVAERPVLQLGNEGRVAATLVSENESKLAALGGKAAGFADDLFRTIF